MKISLNWINEFVEIHDYMTKPQELAQILTFAGLEVESIEDKSKNYNHVVVGLILDKKPHPEADKLSVCQVTTGQGVVHQIVCGAKNHKTNDRVVVALPGAELPNGMKIGEAVLRNVPSKGMLCSFDELMIDPHLPEKPQGIVILPEQAALGQPFSEYWGLDDIIFELKVTPNRADCLSHLGLARELAALLDRPLKENTNVFTNYSEEIKNPFSIDLPLNAEADCQAYQGIYLKDVTVTPSPDWLKKRIEVLGFKSINNVVDITNYIMLETGQPMHAFDAKKIGHEQVVIRHSEEGEPFTSLDGQNYILPQGALVISNKLQGDVLAIAGIIGGKDFSVTPETDSLFLEIANFNTSQIRKTSRKLGIQTESAYRFSRGVDLGVGAKEALTRACFLLAKYTGAKISSDIKSFSSQSAFKAPAKIALSVSFAQQKLGFKIEFDQIEDVLKRIGCLFSKDDSDAQTFWVTPPSWRFDIEADVDLVEEVGRLIGYDKIPETLGSALNLVPTGHQSEYLQITRLTDKCVQAGLCQVLNSVFVSQVKEQAFTNDQSLMNNLLGQRLGGPVYLINPLSNEENQLRTLLTLKMADLVVQNLRQGVTKGQLFEIGSCVTQSSIASAGPQAPIVGSGVGGGMGADSVTYLEIPHLSLALWGKPVQAWLNEPEIPPVLRLKEILFSSIQSWSGINIQVKKPSDRSLLPAFLHKGQSALIYYNNQSIGFIGAMHPLWMEENKIREPVVVAELSLKNFLLDSQIEEKKFMPFIKRPLVERDLALILGKNKTSQEVLDIMSAVFGPILQNVELFDIYEGEKVPEGYRQLAYRLGLQAEQNLKIMTDIEINALIQQLITQLKNELGAQLREA